MIHTYEFTPMSAYVKTYVIHNIWQLCPCAQSCLILCDIMDCSPPGSSVHGIFQARILEWVAISSSRGSSPPRNRTCLSCINRQILYLGATWEIHDPVLWSKNVSIVVLCTIFRGLIILFWDTLNIHYFLAGACRTKEFKILPLFRWFFSLTENFKMQC